MGKLVLWGHHVDEYREMFGLSWADFDGKILEYGSGPSAINTELQEGFDHVVSCDPLFALDKSTLSTKASLIFADMLANLEKARDKFDFSRYGGLADFAAKRQQGMQEFFADFEKGRAENRYIPIYDVRLPFADDSFDFALSSHYLFASLENQDVEFHVEVISELARVAKEVRIFPLIDSNGMPSPLLGPVLLGLQQANFGTEVRQVAYHLQPSGNAILRVWAQQCQLTK